MSDSGITVIGTGAVRTPTDRVEVSIGIETQRDTASAAFQATAASVEDVLAALRDGGVEDRRVRTVDLRLGPRTTYRDNTEILVGYTCGQRLVADVREIGTLPSLLGAVAGSDVEGVRLEGISFAAGDPAAALAEARAAAVEAARLKAVHFAELAGVALGTVTSLSEATASAGPQPLPKLQRMVAAAAPMPVSPGEAEVTVSVEVHFEIG